MTLELGGKSANIIFADADLAQAAAAAPYAVFDNAGQDCCARSRILVERSAYDEFLGLLEPAVQGMAVLDPCDRGQRDGAADLRAASASVVQGYVDEVDVAFTGTRPGRAGFLVAADGRARRVDRTSGSGARRCSGRSSR